MLMQKLYFNLSFIFANCFAMTNVHNSLIVSVRRLPLLELFTLASNTEFLNDLVVKISKVRKTTLISKQLLEFQS